MNNKITKQYFEYTNSADHAEKILKEIITKTNFQLEKEIFRGQIYDKDKVGSLIYKGISQNKPAVLKIQILQPTIDEIDIIKKFNKQNKSTKIRLPKLYDGSKWNEKDGYGYLLLEQIDTPQIYQPPFARQEQIKDFCALYQEYKTKCLRNQNVTVEQITKYLQNWFKEYNKLPIINQDSDFKRKFDIMMATRCIGALLVDIPNQHYDTDRSNFIAHLTELFRDLFEYFVNQLETIKIN